MGLQIGLICHLYRILRNKFSMSHDRNTLKLRKLKILSERRKRDQYTSVLPRACGELKQRSTDTGLQELALQVKGNSQQRDNDYIKTKLDQISQENKNAAVVSQISNYLEPFENENCKISDFRKSRLRNLPRISYKEFDENNINEIVPKPVYRKVKKHVTDKISVDTSEHINMNVKQCVSQDLLYKNRTSVCSHIFGKLYSEQINTSTEELIETEAAIVRRIKHTRLATDLNSQFSSKSRRLSFSTIENVFLNTEGNEKINTELKRLLEDLFLEEDGPSQCFPLVYPSLECISPDSTEDSVSMSSSDISEDLHNKSVIEEDFFGDMFEPLMENASLRTMRIAGPGRIELLEDACSTIVDF